MCQLTKIKKWQIKLDESSKNNSFQNEKVVISNALLERHHFSKKKVNFLPFFWMGGVCFINTDVERNIVRNFTRVVIGRTFSSV